MQITVGKLRELIDATDIPDDTPVTALVFDDTNVSGEGELPVNVVRIEVRGDGIARLVVDTTAT